MVNIPHANSGKRFITGLLGYNRIQTSLLDRWSGTSQTKLREQNKLRAGVNIQLGQWIKEKKGVDERILTNSLTSS